ncbi:Guanine nucleotide exchange factor (GEF) which may activate RAB8A and RAB8B [Chytridiales sp. JEL 0842]|nr:Guanine nucleotide exchange factor (GEF) which may activate RAB8A and RAB8B [Chytridiales sp. JEL 0842]
MVEGILDNIRPPTSSSTVSSKRTSMIIDLDAKAKLNSTKSEDGKGGSMEDGDVSQADTTESALQSAISSNYILQNGPNPDPDCVCKNVISDSEALRCLTCSGLLKPIYRIEQDRQQILSNLAEMRRKFDEILQKEVLAAQETTRMNSRVEELEELMDSRAEELIRLQRDLQAMGEKVVDEIEKRAELQVSKDALQQELDELTKSLFEEANVLVADEARRRHLHEIREKTLEQEIEEMRKQLQMEQLQLKELKQKMSEVSAAEDESNNANEASEDSAETERFESPRATNLRGLGDPIDPQLLREFQEFLKQGPTVKLNKLHTIPFMKNLLDDDITPCLKFGGNPRTSTRRLVDSIVQNSCFVEEMTPAQIANLQAQHATLKELTDPSSAASSGSSSTSTAAKKTVTTTGVTSTQTETEKAITASALAPTHAIFQKTVLERFSTWSTSISTTTTSASTSPQSTSSSTVLPALPASLVINGCSACGKIGPTKHHFKISEQQDDAWCPICQQCRDRLVSVCEFYNFVRHIRQGLFSTRRHEDLYLEVMALKRKMFYARIGTLEYAHQVRPFSRPKAGLRPDSQLMKEMEIAGRMTSSMEPVLKRLNEEIPMTASNKFEKVESKQ